MTAALIDAVKRVIVVAYKENVDQLEQALSHEGWEPEIQRLDYTAEQLLYPAAIRCFLNHREAWRKAADSQGYTLVCEADFVPCVGIGRLRVFWPTTIPLSWGYLYQGSPRLLAIIENEGRSFLRGHCAPLVAYVIDAQVAKIFLDFFDDEASRYGLENYFSFEAHLQWFAMGRGALAFIPSAHYGEHGGRPNAEHARSGVVSRSGEHRADVLVGRLHFLPQYADGSVTRFWATRARYWLLGILRLTTGRWIIETSVYKLQPVAKARMFWTGLRRFIPA